MDYAPSMVYKQHHTCMHSLSFAVADKAEQPIATERELAELRRLQLDWEAAREMAPNFMKEPAFREFVSRHGQPNLSDPDGKIEGEFSRRWEKSTYGCRNASAKALPIAKEIASRFNSEAVKWADRFDDNERGLCKLFGIDFSPGCFAKSIAAVGAEAVQHIPSPLVHTQVSPFDMVPYLNLRSK